MFLKLLEKLGKKRVVLDRGPSHPRYDLAKPWMNRYYLLFRKRPKWFPFNIFIHRIIDNDHGIGLLIPKKCFRHIYSFIILSEKMKSYIKYRDNSKKI